MILFNTTHWELADLVGGWGAHATDTGWRFRPLGEGAFVEVVRPMTGEVAVHEVLVAGEVALAYGWIVVNRVDQRF